MTEMGDFQDKLEKSSIGEAMKEIEGLGIDHHLEHLEEEMKPPWKRRSTCEKCGRDLGGKL